MHIIAYSFPSCNQFSSPELLNWERTWPFPYHKSLSYTIKIIFMNKLCTGHAAVASNCNKKRFEQHLFHPCMIIIHLGRGFDIGAIASHAFTWLLFNPNSHSTYELIFMQARSPPRRHLMNHASNEMMIEFVLKPWHSNSSRFLLLHTQSTGPEQRS